MINRFTSPTVAITDVYIQFLKGRMWISQRRILTDLKMRINDSLTEARPDILEIALVYLLELIFLVIKTQPTLVMNPATQVKVSKL